MSHPVFSSRSTEFRPEHGRSAAWMAAIIKILTQPKLDLTAHLQNDGSQIFRYAEQHGSDKIYWFQVWPDGTIKGGREVPNSE